MRIDANPVVTIKATGSKEIKNNTMLGKMILNKEHKPSNRSSGGYYEGYDQGKKYIVPDSNLEAMANLVNLNMRRRLSIRYKHQTSIDLSENDELMTRLNKLVIKIDQIDLNNESSDSELSNNTSRVYYDIEDSLSDESAEEKEEQENALVVKVVKSYTELVEGGREGLNGEEKTNLISNLSDNVAETIRLILRPTKKNINSSLKPCTTKMATSLKLGSRDKNRNNKADSSSALKRKTCSDLPQIPLQNEIKMRSSPMTPLIIVLDIEAEESHSSGISYEREKLKSEIRMNKCSDLPQIPSHNEIKVCSSPTKPLIVVLDVEAEESCSSGVSRKREKVESEIRRKTCSDLPQAPSLNEIKMCSIRQMEPLTVVLDVEAEESRSSGISRERDKVESEMRRKTCSDLPQAHLGNKIKMCSVRKMEPLIVEVDVEAEDFDGSGISREREKLTSEIRGKKYSDLPQILPTNKINVCSSPMKPLIVMLHVEAEESHSSGMCHVKEKLETARKCSKHLLEGDFDIKQHAGIKDVEEINQFAGKTNYPNSGEYQVRLLGFDRFRSDNLPIYNLYEYNSETDIFQELMVKSRTSEKHFKNKISQRNLECNHELLVKPEESITMVHRTDFEHNPFSEISNIFQNSFNDFPTKLKPFCEFTSLKTDGLNYDDKHNETCATQTIYKKRQSLTHRTDEIKCSNGNNFKFIYLKKPEEKKKNRVFSWFSSFNFCKHHLTAKDTRSQPRKLQRAYSKI